MQRVTPGVGNSFGPVEKELKENFVPELFEGLSEVIPERGVTSLAVKQVGLALPDPSQTSPENWTASCVITGHLVAAIRGKVEFQMADHLACLREGRTAVRRQRQRRVEEALSAALEGDLVLQARRLRQATKTEAWLNVQPSTVNGTDMGDQEWRNALFLRYRLEPPDLPTHFDGFQAKFLISNALDCKKGGLVTLRHNKLRDGVADLAGKSFNPSHVRANPLIYSGLAVKRNKAEPAWSGGTSNHSEVQPPEITEQKGDLIIQDLCQQGTYSVHDMHVVNTDALTHWTKDPEKCLQEAEQGKRRCIWRLASSSVGISPPLLPRWTG